jgi:outer membrane protein W
MKYKLHIKKALLASVLSCFVSTSVQAGAFEKDTVTGTLAIGSAQIFTEDYLIIGLGAGYFVTDGLQLGLDVNVWTGGSPSIYEVTPKITYVFENKSSVKPYAGVFYNRTFIENLEDSNSLGYRAGFYTAAGKSAYVGIGVVYTELQDCNDSAFVNCSSTYTELSFIFTL